MNCELQPSLLPMQLLVPLLLHGPEQMQVQVLDAGAEAIAGARAGATGSAAGAAGDAAPCGAGAGVRAGADVDAQSSCGSH